jgi:hypothetical protein
MMSCDLDRIVTDRHADERGRPCQRRGSILRATGRLRERRIVERGDQAAIADRECRGIECTGAVLERSLRANGHGERRRGACRRVSGSQRAPHALDRSRHAMIVRARGAIAEERIGAGLGIDTTYRALRPALGERHAPGEQPPARIIAGDRGQLTAELGGAPDPAPHHASSMM